MLGFVALNSAVLKSMNVADVLRTNLLVTVLPLPSHLTTLIFTQRLEVPE